MQNAFRAVSFFALLIFEKKNRIFAAQQCDFHELRRECLMPNGSSSSLAPVQLIEGVAIEMPAISRLAHEAIKKLVPVDYLADQLEVNDSPEIPFILRLATIIDPTEAGKEIGFLEYEGRILTIHKQHPDLRLLPGLPGLQHLLWLEKNWKKPAEIPGEVVHIDFAGLIIKVHDHDQYDYKHGFRIAFDKDGCVDKELWGGSCYHRIKTHPHHYLAVAV